ncbi:hypothetical protein H6F86_08385 [Phormidium sp. FACHB-592]|uniref:Uncharacterized protein n=1 Tax=Stenomitos frigidus AS-A4 TaxID=2933935 RepID=A0ABV0KRC0_9CYAN|nr:MULTISPECIES: hypothetical protein [Cyanophyceae]MBD2035308.1 hypothetical protein [Leptolyngbya sp. FACHB-321]MBD2073905.1 hypothetical protein [Phormidium sp. FACHB-592]
MKNDLTEQLTEALDQALRLLNPNNEEHILTLVEGWATLAKAESQTVAFFYEQRGLEAMPSLLGAIGVNEWDWACSFDLPTGYATRVAVTQNMRDDALWWAIALESPEGEHGSLSFTVATVGSEDVARVVHVVETALCFEGYDVFVGSENEWQMYRQSFGEPV